MRRNTTKRSTYIRIFSVFLITHMVLMIGFSAFLVSQEKEAVGKEMTGYSLQISNRVVDILKDNIDDNNQITDLSKVKKEFLNKTFYIPMLEGSELSIFTSDYKLIYNTSNYWKCSYTEYKEGNTFHQGYGLLNPKDWFSDDEVKELENYLYPNLKAEKPGDLYEYSLSIDGFWMDDEIIIPEKIYITPLYADTFDEDGNVVSGGGIRKDNLVYISGYENTKNLPYFEHGSIIPEYSGNPINKNQDELRQMVTDQSILKEIIQQLPDSVIHNERVNGLTYRYYMVVPYQFSIKIMDDQSLYSDFWTTVGTDINIWERISHTLVFVWISCLLIFIIAAYILSKQTYKTYLKREELERHRKEITDALAHDLKTPLSIISGYAQNLEENIYTEKRAHYANHIKKNIERMDEIIREMLDMSKLESDYIKLKSEELSLNEISIGIINRYQNICDEKSITTTILGEAVVKGDRTLLERVIDNFIINAIDNTPEDGEIKVIIFNDTFEVYNSSSYIPEDIIDDIWLPYKKGNVERGNTKGTGLGLSIVRSILELHKFSYGVRNEGDGVIFWFKFK